MQQLQSEFYYDHVTRLTEKHINIDMHLRVRKQNSNINTKGFWYTREANVVVLVQYVLREVEIIKRTARKFL